MADSLDGLTPYQLSQLRDAMGQSGLDQGAMMAGGLPMGAGDGAFDGSIRRSTALSAGLQLSTTQSISDAAWAAVSFDTTLWDFDGMGDVTQPTRLTCRTGGIYLMTGFCQWVSNGAGQRWARILLNGATELAKHSAMMTGTALAQAHSVCMLYPLLPGDYVELQVFQNSGAPLNVNVSGVSPYYQATLSMGRLV